MVATPVRLTIGGAGTLTSSHSGNHNLHNHCGTTERISKHSRAHRHNWRNPQAQPDRQSGGFGRYGPLWAAWDQPNFGRGA